MVRRSAGGAFRLAVALVRPLLMVLTRRDWRGAEHLPREGGFVVVSNHISHVDPFTLAHFLWDNGYPVRYLAKESVFRIPVGGRIVAGAKQIPVYRETGDAARAFSAAVDAVRSGECVGIYPDATLTRDPALWPMVGKTGAARVALTTGCPVIPVAQWGPQEILPPYAKRFRLFPRRTVHVWAGPPVDLSAWQGRPLDPPTLRGATDAITARLTEMLEAIRGEKAPAVRWDPRTHDLPRTGNPHRRQS
ncbi:MAG: lysophospholipid acyltransferase family protein [Actinomycetes bacterium]